MRQIKSKGMKPELAVRRLVYSLGFRFRLHRDDLPGKPDLVFAKKRKVIFVHGCFWHRHPAPACKDSRAPRSNTDYWKPKLDRNVERDAQAVDLLKAQGWSVLTIWECETKHLPNVAARINAFLTD